MELIKLTAQQESMRDIKLVEEGSRKREKNYLNILDNITQRAFRESTKARQAKTFSGRH